MTTSRSLWTDLAAALSVGAGLVHAAAAGTHADDRMLVALFAATALVQVGLGVALLRRPDRWLLIGSGVANVVAVAAWALSRTVGLPLIASLAVPEPVGLQDLSAATLGGAATTCAVLALTRARTGAPGPRRAWIPVLALVPALVGVAAPHEHSESHAHEHGGEAALESAAHAEGAPHDHEPSETVVTMAADPVLVGADTTHATGAELEAAVDLVETTRAGVDSSMDVAAAEAAGYVWIGDGRRPGGFQHYINHSFMVDGIDLDPERVESLVFQNTESGPVLVSTMYVLEVGSTMDDVPPVAGDLTVWHDHQNLCWDASGTRLAGVSTDGETCRPGGELRATPPMLHVWLVENECGPFAGIEGHGSGDCASHEH